MENMSIIVERINEKDLEKIEAIHNILKTCGEDMYIKQGLTHWIKPYSIDKIKQDCNEKEVYIAHIKNEGEYCATFSLKAIQSTGGRKGIEISKIASLPAIQKKGVGKECLDFIENRCKELKANSIKLDVYSESINAINFYKNRGFKIVSSGYTTNFKIYYMEKRITK